MGILLALLLGVAAGAFVLAVPIRMLESITTFTGLSRLMVQAEPPISPNDRTLLSVLAGVFSAGVGWVLVDWLLFGRAGMKQLIRSEDEYEEEDEYSFRPTDPLDLVSPVSTPPGEWSMPIPGDARKPLSALTDIGDPPVAGLSHEGLSPFDRILPGVGTSAPPLAPNAPTPAASPLLSSEPPPLIVPPLSQPASGGIWGDPTQTAQSAAPVWDLPTPAAPVTPAAVVEPTPAPILSGGWMPTPGAPSSMATPEEEPVVVADSSPEPIQMPAPPPLIDTMSAAEPSVGLQQPFSIQDALAALSPDFPPPPAPPVEIAETPAPPPLPVDPILSEPPILAPAPAPVVPQSQPEPQPVAFEPVAPPAPIAPPPPEWPAVQPAPARSGGTPGLAGFDKSKLEDMLDRLERGLHRRREAAAAVASITPPAPVPVSAPAPVPVQAPVIAPVVQQTPPPPPVFDASTHLPPLDRPPAPAAYSAPAFGDMPAPEAPPLQPFAPQPVAYEPPAPVEPAPPPLVPAQPAGSGDNENLLSQPLHMTLEMLRNRVKR